MMPSPILTTYARYKSMQDDFANFLGQTGRLCKAPTNLLQEHEEHQKKDASVYLNPGDDVSGKGRLKGKASKLAQAKVNPEAKAKSEAIKTHKLYVKNYIPLAQHIASSKSIHSIIPTWIMTTLTSIIKDRKETLKHYQGANGSLQAFTSTEQLKRDNEKHEHMINVLRQVRIILCAKHQDDEQRQAAKATKKSARRSKTSDSETVNKFPQQLNTDEDELEKDEMVDGAELDKQREADASAWKATTSVKAGIQFEANVDVSLPDALQALRGLFQEWQNMRARVNQAWKQYADGSIDLGAAAIMANTAIDLARHLEEAVRPVLTRNDEICRQGEWKDFLDSLPSSEGPARNIYSGLFYVLLTAPLQDVNAASLTAVDSECAEVQPLDEADVLNFIDFWFIKPFKMFEARHKVNIFGREAVERALERDCLIQETGRAVSTKPQGRDLTVCQDMVELGFFGRCSDYFRFGFMDEVARAMYLSASEPEFRLWTVFAWQLFLDAGELLNPEHPSQAFDELQDYLESVENLLIAIKDDAAKEVHPPGYSERMDLLLQDGLDRTSHLRTDVVKTIGMKYGVILTPSWIKESEPFRLLRRHPIFCGLALQSIRLCMHEIGSILANSGTKAFMYMAHLYNMCQVEAKKKKNGSDCQDGTSVGAWEDMERLVLSLQPSNVFIGGKAPITEPECSRNFSLVTGLPVANVSLFQRNQSTPMAATREEILKDMKGRNKITAPRKVISFLGDQLYPVSAKFSSRLIARDDRRDLTVEDLRRMMEQSQDQEKKDAGRFERSTAVAVRQLQPSELLVELLNSLDQEVAILKCCSPRLFLDCLHLIRNIDEALKPHLEVEGIRQLPSSSGNKKAISIDEQLPEFRLLAVLTRGVEYVPIARRVLVKWLKSNGGNGAVSFPKPPST